MTNEVVEKTEIKVENGISKEIVKPRVLFSKIQGQINVINRLKFYISSYESSRVIPPLLFVGARGMGKTSLIRETVKGLILFDEHGNVVLNDKGLPARKTYLEINCSTLKSIKDFVGILINNIVDKNVSVMLDECHALPAEISCALLTILNPSKNFKNTFFYNDNNYEIDFTKQSFLFATSESEKILPALNNRLQKICISPFTNTELAEIIASNTEGVEYENGVLENIASCVRGSPRICVLLANDILSYLRGSKVFMMEDWRKLRKILSIYPLGCNENEITLLRFLEKKPTGCSLTALAAKLSLNRQTVQQDLELHLQVENLLEIKSGSGRILTSFGQNYLRELQKELDKEEKQL